MAQETISGTALNDSRTMDAFRKLRNRISKSNINNSNIKGSPYFEETFAIAEVDYFGETLKDKTYLRYNAFSDELEMGTFPDQKTTEEILLKNNKIVTNFGGKRYEYLPYKTKEGNYTKMGYFVVLVENKNYSLYLKRSKVFMEATVARTSLERAFPARFIDNIEYYYNYEGNTLQNIKASKNGLINTFKNHSDFIKTYLKTNKVRFKDDASIVNVFNFVNGSI